MTRNARGGTRILGSLRSADDAGIGRVEVCEPQRLLISTKSADQPDGVIEVTLTADGDQTILVIENRGVPVGIAANVT